MIKCNKFELCKNMEIKGGKSNKQVDLLPVKKKLQVKVPEEDSFLKFSFNMDRLIEHRVLILNYYFH